LLNTESKREQYSIAPIAITQHWAKAFFMGKIKFAGISPSTINGIRQDRFSVYIRIALTYVHAGGEFFAKRSTVFIMGKAGVKSKGY
jgi:hypothetical protein